MILYSDYFSKDPSKMPDPADLLYSGVRSTTSHFVKKGILNPDLSFKQKPNSVLKLIKKPWDGKWRFVIFDIPQEHKNTRELIRHRLKNWDFKFFQRSVWFSPLPIIPYVKKLDKKIDDTNYLSVIEGEILRINPKKLIKEKWQIDSWKQKALKWKEKVENSGKFSETTQSSFWNLIDKHPKVPLDLLPKHWPLETVIKTFTKKKFQI